MHAHPQESVVLYPPSTQGFGDQLDLGAIQSAFMAKTHPGIPLVVLSTKELRTLVHALAILHASGLFARVSVMMERPVEARTRGLICALNLGRYVDFLDKKQPLYRQEPLQFFAVARNSAEVRTPWEETLPADYVAVIVVSEEKKLTRDNGICVPSLDAQSLASALKSLLSD